MATFILCLYFTHRLYTAGVLCNTTLITPSCTSLCPRTKHTAQFNTVETCLRCLHSCMYHNGPAAPVIFQQLRSNHCWNCCSPLRPNCSSSGLSLTAVWLSDIASVGLLTSTCDNYVTSEGCLLKTWLRHSSSSPIHSRIDCTNSVIHGSINSKCCGVQCWPSPNHNPNHAPSFCCGFRTLRNRHWPLDVPTD